MEYQWDKKLLRKLYKDPVVRKELHALYTSLYDVFAFNLNEKYSKKFTFIDDMDHLENNLFVRDYLENIPTYDKVDNYKAPSNDGPFIDIEDALDLTFDFYNNTNSQIFSAFEFFFRQRNTHLRFHQNPFKKFYNANAFVSSSSKHVFIEIKKQNNFALIGTLVHEYAHAINYFLIDFNESIIEQDIACETSSLFMELLAYDFFSKYYDFQTEAENQKKLFYSTFNEDNAFLLTKYDLIDTANLILDERDYAFFHSFFRRLKKEFEINEKELKAILENPASAVMPYSYSALIALELYSIYQNDPEFALYLYTQFIHLKAQTSLELDEKIKKLGINPTQSIDSFIKSLKW